HRFARRRVRRGEGRDEVALLAAEKVVDRHAERLALDVVKRDVERRDRRLQHAAAFEVLAAIELLPDSASLERIAPDEQRRIVLERPHHRLLAAGKPALAPAEDPLIGLDLDQQLVPDPYPDGI